MGVLSALGTAGLILLTIILWIVITVTINLGLIWFGTKYKTVVNWVPWVQNLIGMLILIGSAVLSYVIIW